MNISAQMTVPSAEGEAVVVREVARPERRRLRPETRGTSLAEAGAILAGLQQTLPAGAADPRIATQAGRCPHCGRERACKGHHAIVFRTPFGKVKLKSAQRYRCRCEGEGPKRFSPLAARLPERTSPEWAYLETKFAALVSDGLTVELLREVLPIYQEFNPAAIQQQVRRTADPLEADRGEGRDVCFDAGVRDGNALVEPSAPWIVGPTALTSTPRASAPEPKSGLR